ncbi:FMN-binding negative transcriptional regulator [Bacillus sp. RAR_GA_16]|uniref:FMN-binding negative transcriptional regulator n=1 Tax=Bacillus sp. RAR_GA_16 TaxID=2876774 RepID=UPI001CCF957E|nr:FMN-binding negative transcriptional regulator [Bacillus sp. RAR_GA_16]MCA0170917.1 FMN-binding negative transcriptional regulator [Bacillus sp. RAR_GA_16]
MYIPSHFKMDDEEQIFQVIKENGFGILVSMNKGEPVATHLPLMLNKSKGALYDHFARPNKQWKESENQQVLAIFQGPHSYISPTWYETTKAVPTWNYVAVHVYGKIEFFNEQEEVFRTLNDLVTKYEPSDSVYHLKNLDTDYIEGMSKGIVAFRINITKIEAKSKLSQNHSRNRQRLIMNHLESTSQQDHLQIASLMKKNLKNAPDDN